MNEVVTVPLTCVPTVLNKINSFYLDIYIMIHLKIAVVLWYATVVARRRRRYRP